MDLETKQSKLEQRFNKLIMILPQRYLIKLLELFHNGRYAIVDIEEALFRLDVEGYDRVQIIRSLRK